MSYRPPKLSCTLLRTTLVSECTHLPALAFQCRATRGVAAYLWLSRGGQPIRYQVQ